ncbi:hypothetical protein BH23ACT6_BH23ACT6_13530 [soil metagenome]
MAHGASLLEVAVTAGVLAGEGVAAVMSGVTGPILAVGNRAVDWAPRPAKEFAIETFGTADKPVLIGSVLAVVALISLALGWWGTRRRQPATIGFVVLVAIAAVAMVTDRAASASTLARLLPVVAMAVVGVGGLIVMLRAVGRPGRQHAGSGSGRATSLETDRLAVDRRAFVTAASVVAAAGAGRRQQSLIVTAHR